MFAFEATGVKTASRTSGIESTPGLLRRFLPHWPLAATAMVALVIGYFAGREHVKYELRQAFASVGESMARGLGFSESASEKAAPPKPKPEISNVKVLRASLSRDDSNQFMPTSVIELSVVNNTGRPIRRLYFHGTLQTPGRSTPWVEGDFNYEIPGGLESGETQTWHLEPGFGSPFMRPTEYPGAQFVVKVVDLDWAE